MSIVVQCGECGARNKVLESEIERYRAGHREAQGWWGRNDWKLRRAFVIGFFVFCVLVALPMAEILK